MPHRPLTGRAGAASPSAAHRVGRGCTPTGRLSGRLGSRSHWAPRNGPGRSGTGGTGSGSWALPHRAAPEVAQATPGPVPWRAPSRPKRRDNRASPLAAARGRRAPSHAVSPTRRGEGRVASDGAWAARRVVVLGLGRRLPPPTSGAQRAARGHSALGAPGAARGARGGVLGMGRPGRTSGSCASRPAGRPGPWASRPPTFPARRPSQPVRPTTRLSPSPGRRVGTRGYGV